MIKKHKFSDETTLVFCTQTPQSQRCKCSYANADISRKPLTDCLTNVETKKDFGSTQIQFQDVLSATLARVGKSFDRKDYSPTII